MRDQVTDGSGLEQRRRRATVPAVCIAWPGAAAAVFVGTMIVGQPVGAVTLTNQDTKTYHVTVILDGEHQDHELSPGKSMSGFCEDGCVIRLNGSPENDYALEGSERVSIEGGLVYYDGEEPQKKPGAESGDGRDGRSPE
ncbi:MAG: hypothetical protein KKB37_04905 [Alphaproteobacteria bacterium]|nr:hypothetical protein [Alphaproteobacteria bacterium]